MRKTMIFLLAALLALWVCGCSAGQNTTTYTVGEYVVDQENGTISDGTYTYQYTFSGNAFGYSIGITYPDGSTYSWDKQTSNGWGFGSGGWSDDYDPDRYVSGEVLCDILEAGTPRPEKPVNPLCFLLLAVGLFNIIFPQTAWYLSDGWKFKDAEPSETALGLARFGGGVCIFIGVLMLLGGLLG